MDLQLSEIEIKNLLSYKNTKFDNLKNFNVLIGKNNAGKSNLFKLLRIIQQNLQNRSLKPGILFNNNPELQGQISLTFRFSDEYQRNLFLDLHSRNTFLNILRTTIKLPGLDENEIIDYLIENRFYHSVKITLLYLSSIPDILILQKFHLIHKDEKLQCIYQVKQEDGKISIYLLSQPVRDSDNILIMEEYIEYGQIERVDQEYPKNYLGHFFSNNHYGSIYLASIRNALPIPIRSIQNQVDFMRECSLYYTHRTLVSYRDRDLRRPIQANDNIDIVQFVTPLVYFHYIVGEKYFMTLANQAKLDEIYSTVLCKELLELKPHLELLLNNNW